VSGRPGAAAEQAPDCPFGEFDVVRCASGHLDGDRFERGEEGAGDVPERWAGRDHPAGAAGSDQLGAVGEQPVDDLGDRTADRMVLAGELDPQGQQDAGDVAAAVDGVAARDREQRLNRVGFGGESSASSSRARSSWPGKAAPIPPGRW
jgi:hypothetical protein